MSEALALLDGLQAAAGMSPASPIETDKLPARLRRWASETPGWDEQSTRPRGAAEPLINSLIFGRVADEVEEAASELGMTLPGPVAIGTVESTGFGARTIRPDLAGDSYLIALDSEFSMFAYLLAKVVAFAVPEVDPLLRYGAAVSVDAALVDRRAAGCPLVGDAFVDFVDSACLRGRPSHVRSIELPDWRQGFAASLTTSIERFVVGHEYGHILGGSTWRERRSGLLRVSTGGRPVRDAWLDELEADAYGAVLAVACGDDQSLVETSRAVFLYLHAIQMVDTGRVQAWGLFAARRSSETHPPIELRCLEIEAGLKSVVGAARAAEVVAEAHGLTNVLDVLWRRERSRVLRLRRDTSPCLSHGRHPLR